MDPNEYEEGEVKINEQTPNNTNEIVGQFLTELLDETFPNVIEEAEAMLTTVKLAGNSVPSDNIS